MKRQIATLLGVIAFVLGTVGCGSRMDQQAAGSSAPTGRVIIHVDGSSTVFPITEAVAEEFQKSEPNIKVVVGLSGTGGGFKKFLRLETEINNASRPIKQTEIDKARAAGIEYVELEVAYDGLAVLVNHDNKFVDYLTLAELKKVWEPDAQGKILYWDQVRRGWPHKKIGLYGPGLDSGTYDYFTEVICGKSGSSRGDFTASEDDNVLVQGIYGDPNALGYFGLAYYEENRDKLKIVPVDGGNGPVEPSLETVKSGKYSPLSRPLFIYVRKDVLFSKPGLVKFIEFYLQNAGKLVSKVGYVPLPEEKYQEQVKTIRNIARSAGVS